MSAGIAVSISEYVPDEYCQLQEDIEPATVITKKPARRPQPVDFESANPLATPGVTPASRMEIRPQPVLVPFGISALDRLTGGIPRGALTEIIGHASSGRTSLLLSLLAAMTQRQEVCAVVDVSDNFDPASAQTAGLDLPRLLWVRCRSHVWRGHSCPRVSAGSESHSEKILTRNRSRLHTKPEFRALDQALKATDLLLQSGGFGLIVMDLGSVPAEMARRIPLTSWFRFRRAVEKTPTILLAIERESCAKTCASLVLHLAARHSAASTQPEQSSETAHSGQLNPSEPPSHGTLLRGLEIKAEVLRAPDLSFQRKPVRSVRTEFESRTPWTIAG
ncbi:MAG TPA: hypothetical protein VEG30_09655 [Terriglobales bacterium]|nr:hypothetical protein [Terriglobales bacterium]